MRNKSDALGVFIQFKSLVENKLDKKIKALQSDWGCEFRAFTNLALQSGIDMRLSCPHTSVQNGRSERKHKHITEIRLTSFAEASMPLHYW